jgi:hypothetical protein
VIQQLPPEGERNERVDIVVNKLSNIATFVKVVIIEDKQASLATRGSAWQAALKQAEDYANLYRQDNSDFTTYGMVNIGTYARFYEMKPERSDWDDFVSSVPYSQAQPLEARRDEALIHNILIDLESKTRRFR